MPMKDLEDRIEELISNSTFKEDFCTKLNAFLTPAEKEVIDLKIDNLMQNMPNSSFNDILPELHTFLLNNLPDHVNEMLRNEITKFINQNINNLQ